MEKPKLVMKQAVKMLTSQGYAADEGNLINAENFFFGYRILEWAVEQNNPEAIMRYMMLLEYYNKGKVEIHFDEENNLRFRETELFGIPEEDKQEEVGNEKEEE